MYSTVVSATEFFLDGDLKFLHDDELSQLSSLTHQLQKRQAQQQSPWLKHGDPS